MRTALSTLLWGAAALPLTAWAEQSGETPLSRLPLQRDADPGWGGVGVLQFALAAVLLAAWLGWLIWRRRGLRGIFSPVQRDGLKVVQSAALTARASLHVVRWDGREWLLGCTERGITPLAERAQPSSSDASDRVEP